MNSREDVNYSGFSRKSVMLAALGLALVSGVLAILFCLSRMEARQYEVRRAYEQRVSAWLNDAVQTMEAWDKEMSALRLRISGAETYRLFAGDLFGLDKRVTGSINSGAPGIELSGNIAVLSEEVPVIRNVSLDVYENEFLVVLGPGQCGKSTLLKIIAGLEMPDTCHGSYGSSSLRIVSGKHPDLDPLFLKRGHRVSRGRLHTVRNGGYRECPVTVGKPDHRMCGRFQSGGLCRQDRIDGDVFFFHETSVSGQIHPSAGIASDSVARDAFKTG